MIRRQFQFQTKLVTTAALLVLGSGGLALAQESAGGWRRAGDPPAAPASAPDPQPVAAPLADEPQPPGPPPLAAPERSAQPPAYGLPPELTVRAGTYLTVRVNEKLSSNKNQPGDPFSATLAQPLVVDGVVVAQRGQSVYGRVAEAAKSRGGKPSRLALELTELTLADGLQVPLRSRLTPRKGETTPASDQAGTVIGATAVGALIGAMADDRGGAGTAIGAGLGATAGAIAVLATRNKASVVYPETALTFSLDAPILVSTARAPQAFRFVDPNEFDRPVQAQASPERERRCLTCGVWGPMWGPYGYDPYLWGPRVGVVIHRDRGYRGRRR